MLRRELTSDSDSIANAVQITSSLLGNIEDLEEKSSSESIDKAPSITDISFKYKCLLVTTKVANRS